VAWIGKSLFAVGIIHSMFATWSFVVLTAIGIVVMPISGIWLLVPPVTGMVVRWRRFR
jgi:hypothetical protein